MSNTRAICPWDEDSRGKLRVILDGLTKAEAFASKGWGSARTFRPGRLEPYQVVGGVTAHQAFDGYPD